MHTDPSSNYRGENLEKYLGLLSELALAGRLRAGTELPINLQNFGLDTPLKASLNQYKGVNVVNLGGELENGRRLAYALQSRLPRQVAKVRAEVRLWVESLLTLMTEEKRLLR